MVRKIFCGCIIIVLASMVFVSCAPMQKITISEDNLAQLKGRWTGIRSPDSISSLNTDLEISTNSFPVQGKWIFYGVAMSGNLATTQIIDFKGGMINGKGNLLITDSAVEAELSLYKDDDKMWLEGTFSSQGGGGRGAGTMLLRKK